MIDDPKHKKQNSKKTKKPKKISPSYLENAAVYYLQRFDSTAENLRRVLSRKVKRATAPSENNPNANLDHEQAHGWIEDVVKKMQHLGYIDDVRTAGIKARGMFARGTAPRKIKQKLSQVGAPAEAIDQALNDLAEENGEALNLKAAIKLAKRRRLGPYRDTEKRDERRDKDLAALARAGFDLETARRVIDCDDPDELLEDFA